LDAKRDEKEAIQIAIGPVQLLVLGVGGVRAAAESGRIEVQTGL